MEIFNKPAIYAEIDGDKFTASRTGNPINSVAELRSTIDDLQECAKWAESKLADGKWAIMWLPLFGATYNQLTRFAGMLPIYIANQVRLVRDTGGKPGMAHFDVLISEVGAIPLAGWYDNPTWKQYRLAERVGIVIRREYAAVAKVHAVESGISPLTVTDLKLNLVNEVEPKTVADQNGCTPQPIVGRKSRTFTMTTDNAVLLDAERRKTSPNWLLTSLYPPVHKPELAIWWLTRSELREFVGMKNGPRMPRYMFRSLDEVWTRANTEHPAGFTGEVYADKEISTTPVRPHSLQRHTGILIRREDAKATLPGFFTTPEGRGLMPVAA